MLVVVPRVGGPAQGTCWRGGVATSASLFLASTSWGCRTDVGLPVGVAGVAAARVGSAFGLACWTLACSVTPAVAAHSL